MGRSGSARRKCRRRAGCSTSLAAMTRPSPASRGASACAGSGRAYLCGRRGGDGGAAEGLLHRAAAEDAAGGASAPGYAAARVHRRLPALRHHAHRADADRHPRIAAGDELPYINDITQIMPRLLASPLTYPEALAELWMGDQRDGLNKLRDYYLNRAAKSGIFKTGADSLHRQDAAERDASRADRAALPAIAASSTSSAIRSTCCSRLFQPPHAWLLLRGGTGERRQALQSGGGLIAHYRQNVNMRYLPVRYEDVVVDQEANVRRILDFVGWNSTRAAWLRAEHALCPHGLLCAGDGKALRPLALPLPAISETSAAVC